MDCSDWTVVLLVDLPVHQVKTVRPDPILAVVCGSLCIAEAAFAKRFGDYQALLER